jgi:hypothetical protein
MVTSNVVRRDIFRYMLIFTCFIKIGVILRIRGKSGKDFDLDLIVWNSVFESLLPEKTSFIELESLGMRFGLEVDDNVALVIFVLISRALAVYLFAGLLIMVLR